MRVGKEPNKPAKTAKIEGPFPHRAKNSAGRPKKRLLHIKSESSNRGKIGPKKQTIGLLGT